MRFFIVLFALMISGCAFDGPPLGMRFQQPYATGGLHQGLDLDVPLGTPVRSIATGKVIYVAQVNLRGIITNIVSIQHDNGYLSRYLHIDNVLVQEGQDVAKGQPIAKVALNGPIGFTNMLVRYPHLHLEIYNGATLLDPESLNMRCGLGPWMWPVGCKIN